MLELSSTATGLYIYQPPLTHQTTTVRECRNLKLQHLITCSLKEKIDRFSREFLNNTNIKQTQL